MLDKRGGDLAQGQRVRAGQHDELAYHPGGRRTAAGLQQPGRRGLGQALHGHRARHTPDRGVPAYREQHRDPFRRQPSGGEQQRIGRSAAIDRIADLQHRISEEIFSGMSAEDRRDRARLLRACHDTTRDPDAGPD
ncbi:hypothetical protein [Nonomuraea longispora]|uniref:hypothetical protein n=1 Tax=Nonomuraea longispora TaxID=1848320 RepID=UPI001404C91B|nr:hypothetical protein [Nonomuraea longispora]